MKMSNLLTELGAWEYWRGIEVGDISQQNQDEQSGGTRGNE